MIRKTSIHNTRKRALEIANPTGFTFVEFMVLFGILVILFSIFIPYFMRVWEMDRRTRCANNLRQIGEALSNYANANGRNFPRVIYDEVNHPTGYAAFSGPDDENPFAANSTVQPNDVTASLWLLVRDGLASPRVFVCPGADDSVDLMDDGIGRKVKPAQRGNFRKRSNLSYSYASPFSNAFNFKLNSDWVKQEFALMADKNPGIGADSDVTAPVFNADPIAMSRANSLQHGRAGQNVLYPNKVVEFKRTPYAGASYAPKRADNIYTARALHTATQPSELPVELNGYTDESLSPAAPDDSYLVPTARDVASPSRHIAPATIPTTAAATPTTAPMTSPATKP